jgi:uncharacterized protein (DUF885 family)
MKISIPFYAFLAVILSFTACHQNESKTTASTVDSVAVKQLNTIFNKYWDERSKLFPLEATANGDNRYNDQLPNDQTKGFRDSLRTFYQSYLDMVKAFDREKLDESSRISYDIFIYRMGMELKELQLNEWMMPFQQFWGLPLMMGVLGSGNTVQPFKTAKDYDNWLGRMGRFSVWTDSAIANFRQGMKAGVVLPKALVQKMIPQMQSMVVNDPVKSIFYSPLKNFPKEITDEEKKILIRGYRLVIMNDIVPSYRKLRDFLKNEYLPKARLSSGYSDLPGGKEMYDYYVQYWTTTNKTPEEIYQTGLAEVKRISSIMDSIKNAVGFKGDMKAFFEYMKTDKKFMPFKTPEEVLNAYRSILQRIEPNIKKMYGHVPKTPFEIRQTEAFRAASASAEYIQGSPDGTRPGIFYVPIVNAKKFNITSGMESTFLHEAIPGHHFAISIQQENKDLPAFRRFGGNGAFDEGYALYCESLGKELGVYTDPYQYMGALGDQMLRAVRLVVDVAIHTKGMTREQAIQYMLDHEPISKEFATEEIERYMAIPGQALSYMVGALKIRELRNKYEKELGAKFKLADFHDELLKDGSMPLSVLENKMNAWAEKMKIGNN